MNETKIPYLKKDNHVHSHISKKKDYINPVYYYNIWDNCGNIVFDDDINETITLDMDIITPSMMQDSIIPNSRLANELVIVDNNTGISCKYLREIWCFNQNDYLYVKNILTKYKKDIKILPNISRTYRKILYTQK